jgi:hypothetical protein
MHCGYGTKNHNAHFAWHLTRQQKSTQNGKRSEKLPASFGELTAKMPLGVDVTPADRCGGIQVQVFKAKQTMRGTDFGLSLKT